MRKAAPRATDDDGDTPAPVARRARPAAADDDNDDAPAATAGRRAAATAAATHQDPAAGDAAPVVRRRVAAASDVTPAQAAGATTTATAAAAAAPAASAVAVVDYDALTYEQFLAQLRSTTREQCIANAAAARRLAAGETGAGEGSDGAEVARPAEAEAFPDQTGGYSYTVLLDRVYEELHLKNPHLSGGDAARSQLPQPIIERHGAKKTAVANFQKICEALHRTLDEVKDYIDKELSTQSALDGNNCLLMKLQNVKSTQFENVVLKYVAEFVKCNSCRSLDTELAKDAERRMLLLRCSNCKAERNVKSSSQGFKAETGKRSKARAAAL